MLQGGEIENLNAAKEAFTIHSTCPSIPRRIIVIPNFIEVFYVMRSE
jgi:hypothetical protein